jgi:hypothetical protein
MSSGRNRHVYFCPFFAPDFKPKQASPLSPQLCVAFCGSPPKMVGHKQNELALIRMGTNAWKVSPNFINLSVNKGIWGPKNPRKKSVEPLLSYFYKISATFKRLFEKEK